jgi:hypothetical protein
MATHHVIETAVIDAPAARVYDIIADYRNGHPNILPKENFLALDVEKGGVGAGTVVSVRMKLFGQTRTMRMEVSEPKPGCMLKEIDLETGTATTFIVQPQNHGTQAHVTIDTELVLSKGFKGTVEKMFVPSALKKVYARELGMLEQFAQTS